MARTGHAHSAHWEHAPRIGREQRLHSGPARCRLEQRVPCLRAAVRPVWALRGPVLELLVLPVWGTRVGGLSGVTQGQLPKMVTPMPVTLWPGPLVPQELGLHVSLQQVCP